MSVSLTIFGFKGTGACIDILNGRFGSGTPANYWLAVFVAAPSAGGGGTEASWTGYSRLSITNNRTNFPLATTALMLNGVDWTMGVIGAVGAPFTVVGVGLVNTASGALGASDIERYVEINPPRQFNTGDTFTAFAGTVQIGER